MDRVLTMILAGGSPDPLGVLGHHRAKTAVPFGGRYRLIDFPLSNCVNSGLRQIFILAQYNPASLRRHIRLGRPWDLDRNDGGLRVLMPYSGVDRTSWFRGTADALIQNIEVIKRSQGRYVLVLSGDHVYKMDYRELFHRHITTGATTTLATRPVRPGDGNRFGILKMDEAGIVTSFAEKPGKESGSDASLGIYLFDRDWLLDRLQELAAADRTDLVRDLIMPSVGTERIATYRYDGFWEDIGDLNAYYRANLLLVDDDPPLVLDDPAWPIFTRMESVSPSWFAPGSNVSRSLIGSGSIIKGEVHNSVIFPQVRVERGAVVKNSILLPGVQVSAAAQVHRAIIDKQALIGERAVFSGAEGLAVLGKGCVVEPGTTHMESEIKHKKMESGS